MKVMYYVCNNSSDVLCALFRFVYTTANLINSVVTLSRISVPTWDQSGWITTFISINNFDKACVLLLNLDSMQSVDSDHNVQCT